VEFEKMFPAKQPSKVVILTNDGRSFEEYLEYPKGDSRQPMTMLDLETKFISLSNAVLSKERLSEVKDVIFSCENISARDFMSACVLGSVHRKSPPC
jgi:2-methylcitrate dehydratase